MDCQHCGEHLTDKVEFDEHVNHHTNVQTALSRAKHRTLGAVYISAKSKDNAEGLREASSINNKKSERPASHDVPPLLGHSENWAARTTEATGGLQRILESYPVVPYSANGPQLDGPMTTASDVSCKHCPAIFSNSDDLTDHYLSKYCPGISIIVHLMIYDRKCEICFETEKKADEHEGNHLSEDAKCLHCAKIFTTSHELEQHYDFHDDMEFRHTRDRLRTGEPYCDDGDRSFLEQPGVERLAVPSTNKESKLTLRSPYEDGDLIAISFISGEDLERVHAPRGVLKEPSPYYYYIPAHLDPDHEPGSVSYYNGELCVTAGRIESFLPGDQDHDLPASQAAIPDVPKPTSGATSPVLKTSGIFCRIRRLFHRVFGLGKGKAADNQERSSTLTEFNPPSRQQTDISAILYRQSSSANEGTPKPTQAQDRNKFSTSEKCPKACRISVHGHGIPGRMFITDESNRTIVVTGHLIGNILRRIVDYGDTGKWRAKAAGLLVNANASKEQGDAAKAINNWIEALSIFHENPELDPDGTFELVVLWEVAKCLNDLQRALDAEEYFLATIKLSERKFGRESPNSYNCINCLGVLYEKLGRIGEAAAMYQRSIAGRAKVLGELHWDTAMSLQELGMIHLRLNNYAAARPLLEKSLRGFENDEGPHENFTLIVMTNLCNVYQALGMIIELRQIVDQLVPMALLKLGPEHLITGAATRKYVECYGRENLPPGLIQRYRDIYKGTGSEVARWVLELC
ncbi:hypothetical protein BU24DRAFT_448012 [Aaosphaeria arxii CBS 175.79]|uniref:C2H2-type domain-containing protein n=1 Tax=Aaosphaeria arxii CBS 175.79 TaxID=1450172 RepID=A0A6A5Y1T8_9PLEO|nr:uncharacterized protein BU24DRAFT_448012 [Aaosphaeria arxii CBS 175.79]KAF2019535.1 hypothetical protein BU24DRAFT_448012 [Aaosphaeria arxii CBS 175.79]